MVAPAVRARMTSAMMDAAGSLLVFIFVRFFFVLVVILIRNGMKLERVGGDDLKICATFGAGDNVAFVEFVFIQIEIAVALRTQNHLNFLLAKLPRGKIVRGLTAQRMG
jgi:hypothetical protein